MRCTYVSVASSTPSTTSNAPDTRSRLGPIRRSMSARRGDDASPSAVTRNGTPIPIGVRAQQDRAATDLPERAAM